ncbi:hypothetical protein [Anaplasma phagocytophilum]|uniref:Uncharacterized protein n=1 Tax=Anaplasma phagocytophilum str. ApWI1 TaxID=1359155 RepID=A0A0F3PXG1_ANAPH|nr:hypothetical protein [Anaplasma phagocytophilum]AGR80912.1 hypothetical protein WSQ_05265 [Anaplasma phagocytophilum str. JM]KJV59693.1 hypothetical protein APHWEB_0841 [Anaplasma phagocytophilum str. Webster]KJV82764.1 hypothetical protein APHHGE2_1472 [Anaplasma phagocytophilum str. HGE2]KJV84408.1 hypothetical protein APHWI1_0680 [Anaplasma phagocytophilum str. ApWI1]AGR82168.1 hypothetical protein YYY_05275 [Anaplasma phagocytophilum str. Dog2]
MYKFVAYISCKDIDTYLKDHKYNFEESINNGGFNFRTEKMLLMYVVILDIFQYFTRYTKDNHSVKGLEYPHIMGIQLKYNQYYDIYIG